MLSDVLHTVAKLQASLQSKDIDLASVPTMVDSTTKRLKEMKDVSSSTWFKDHSMVFTDTAQLGSRNIVVKEEDKSAFLRKVYCPYLQSVIDHINARMESNDLISSMSVFDPRHLPDTEKELSNYGMEKIRTLLNFYGVTQEGMSQPDIDAEETESEWKLFRRVVFTQYKSSTLQDVVTRLISSEDMSAAFPNLSKLAEILEVLPVTTAILLSAHSVA